MNKREIAENYINGNHIDVKEALMNNAHNVTVILGRAFDVYQYIRGWYGATEALRFSNWLQIYSDLESCKESADIADENDMREAAEDR